MKPKKIITVTPQEFMAMTLNQGDVLKQINGKLLNTAKPTVKRIAIKKNKIVPVIPNTPVSFFYLYKELTFKFMCYL